MMNDYELMAILSNLTIKERFSLSPVSKQFSQCIERLNLSQKTLRIRLKNLERRRHHQFDEDIVISERMVNSLNRIIDINIEEVMKRWTEVLKKFENLEKIEFVLNTISESVFQWINHLFPDLKSVNVQIMASSDWTTNKLKSIETYFGTKCHIIIVKRFRHFERLLSTDILKMPSLQSLTLSVSPSEESLRRLLTELPVTVSSLAINNLIYSSNNQILQSFPKTNQIKRLKLSFSNFFDGNHLLKYFCKNLPQLTSLYLIIDCINSLDAIKSAKHLKYLTLYPMSVSVVDIGVDNSFISNEIKRLRFYGSFQMENKFIESLDTMFPRIRGLHIDNLKIYCDCPNQLKVCFICHKKLLENCSQLIHRSMAGNNCLETELVVENSEPYHQIILMSMLELYFDGNQSYRMIVKTYRTQYVAVVLLEAANTIALKRPNTIFRVIVNQVMSFDLENMFNILSRNLRLEFVDYDYENKPKTDEKFIFLELSSKKDKVFVYMGNRTQFMKRFHVFIYL